MRSFSLVLLLLAPIHHLRAAEPVVEGAVPDKTNKIVLIAGSNFFKVGEHDYIAAMSTLYDLLKQTPGVSPVLVIDWPKKEDTFKNAAAVVLMLDGGPKHPLIKDDRFAQLQKMAEGGCGIVQLHQIADYPKDFGDRARSLVGAAWEPGYSARAHWVHEFTAFPKHDIFNGVKSFKIDDGWLTKLRFAEGMKGVTPLLSTFDRKKQAGEKPEFDVVAWAYERPTGKSFTFTGGHLNASFAEEGYRKFLANGVLWSAGVAVPKDGAVVELKKEDVGKYLRAAPEKK